MWSGTGEVVTTSVAPSVSRTTAPDPLQVGRACRSTVSRWNSAPSGRKHGRVRDPSIRVAGRGVPQGLDEPQRRDHDPGVAEQLVRGGIRGRALRRAARLVRVGRAVVAERIHEPAVDRPGRLGGPLAASRRRAAPAPGGSSRSSRTARPGASRRRCRPCSIIDASSDAKQIPIVATLVVGPISRSIRRPDQQLRAPTRRGRSATPSRRGGSSASAWRQDSATVARGPPSRYPRPHGRRAGPDAALRPGRTPGRARRRLGRRSCWTARGRATGELAGNDQVIGDPGCRRARSSRTAISSPRRPNGSMPGRARRGSSTSWSSKARRCGSTCGSRSGSGSSSGSCGPRSSTTSFGPWRHRGSCASPGPTTS